MLLLKVLEFRFLPAPTIGNSIFSKKSKMGAAYSTVMYLRRLDFFFWPIMLKWSGLFYMVISKTVKVNIGCALAGNHFIDWYDSNESRLLFVNARKRQGLKHFCSSRQSYVVRACTIQYMCICTLCMKIWPPCHRFLQPANNCTSGGFKTNIKSHNRLTVLTIFAFGFGILS